jgi:hypothetical protein
MKKYIFAFILFLVFFTLQHPAHVNAATTCIETHNAFDRTCNGYAVRCVVNNNELNVWCCDLQSDCDALQSAPPTCASQNPAASCFPSGQVCLPQNPPINPNIGCPAGQQCGIGCVPTYTPIPTSGQSSNPQNVCESLTGDAVGKCKSCAGAWTAVGCITVNQDNPSSILEFILKLGLGLAGGIAFLLILFGGLQIMTSAGNPEQLTAGRELITSAIIGLILILFSIFLLQFIGVNIIGIPGFISN